MDQRTDDIIAWFQSMWPDELLRPGIARSKVPARCWENKQGLLEVATRYRAYR